MGVPHQVTGSETPLLSSLGTGDGNQGATQALGVGTCRKDHLSFDRDGLWQRPGPQGVSEGDRARGQQGLLSSPPLPAWGSRALVRLAPCPPPQEAATEVVWWPRSHSRHGAGGVPSTIPLGAACTALPLLWFMLRPEKLLGLGDRVQCSLPFSLSLG